MLWSQRGYCWQGPELKGSLTWGKVGWQTHSMMWLDDFCRSYKFLYFFFFYFLKFRKTLRKGLKGSQKLGLITVWEENEQVPAIEGTWWLQPCSPCPGPSLSASSSQALPARGS